MSDVPTPKPFSSEEAASYRTRLEEIRRRAGDLLSRGTMGMQIAAVISEGVEHLILDLFHEAVGAAAPQERERLAHSAAVIAIGGTGRAEMSPYSDVDLLFVYHKQAESEFQRSVSQFVRDCWDAGIKLGHSIQTVPEAIRMAQEDAHFATALVDARHLWGSEAMCQRLRRSFYRRLVRGQRRAFISECVTARQAEQSQHNATVQQLEPDIKRSMGGLRDIQLIRWVGFATVGASDINSLRLHQLLGPDDARRLVAAHEFLTHLRIDMHLHAGKPQDVLTRAEQLRIAESRKVDSTTGQSSVERFMQQYFRHSMVVADLTKRFLSLNNPTSARGRLWQSLASRRVDRIFRMNDQELDVVSRQRDSYVQDIESIVRVFQTAALYGVNPAPLLIERIKQAMAENSFCYTPELAKPFLTVLGTRGNLGSLLRIMYDTGVLELLIPQFAHTRALLQFNQYHSFTVDEHTLRAVEAAAELEHDEGPVGAAYRDIHNKDILHLALLLHDVGKGYEEDHSEVGKRIAADVASQLQLNDVQSETLIFLVHKHLQMSHLAFRRDISDPEVLFRFARDVGSPETLRMLYALTASDLKAVGAGVWTEWKADLLSELFDLTMMTLSGQHPVFRLEHRLNTVKSEVVTHFVSSDAAEAEGETQKWAEKQIDALTPQYLIATPVERIVEDLQTLKQLEPGQIIVQADFDDETQTTEYRIITDQMHSKGCCHRIAGVLTAKHLEIISAQITTNSAGIIIDSFRVVDRDYPHKLPRERVDEITRGIQSVLMESQTVQDLFQRHRRFDSKQTTGPISDLPMRVVLDNDTSDRCTIIDVFAHDESGLLYTILRTLFRLELSVEVAKISTHLDQVVDVFYVTDIEGMKIQDEGRLKDIREQLITVLELFEKERDLMTPL